MSFYVYVSASFSLGQPWTRYIFGVPIFLFLDPFGPTEDLANTQSLLILFLPMLFKSLILSSQYYAREKKPNSKGYMLYDPMYMTFWKRQTVDLENRCQEWGGGGGLTTKGHGRIFLR